MADPEIAAQDFWAALQGGTIPDTWRGKLSGEEGYRVQLAVQRMHDAAGDKRVGWKVAATSRAVQQQLGLTEPAFGSVRASKKYASGHRLDLAGLTGPHAECELCLEVNADISKVRTLDDIRYGISRCFPSFEISEKRVPISDFGMCMADNAEHTAIVLGEPISDLFSIDFRQVECHLRVDDVIVGQARGEAVFGNPLRSVFWLKERLEKYGESLREGMLVMTGSFIRQTPIKPDESFVVSFSGVGEAAFVSRLNEKVA